MIPVRLQRSRAKGSHLVSPNGLAFTEASPDDLAAIKALANVTFVPATATKRFARQIQGRKTLTEKQRQYLWGIVWHFRRQIADQRLIEIARGREATGKGQS